MYVRTNHRVHLIREEIAYWMAISPRLILLLGFNSCRKPQNGTQSQGLNLGLTLNGLNFKLPGLLT